jgi:hypothetical protein
MRACDTFFRRLIVACLAVIALCGPARALNREERAFIWQEANTRMLTAATPADFLAAAATYRKLVDAGIGNGPLFVNLGTAWLQAGRPAAALDAYLRAERYGGSDPEIERGIRSALARLQKTPDAPLPWYRFLLFWHYRLPCAVRVAIALGAFTGVWLALVLRLLGRRVLARPLLAVGLLTLAVFASSAAATLYQEAHTAQPLLPLNSPASATETSR